jgi:hypothetical protein
MNGNKIACAVANFPFSPLGIGKKENNNCYNGRDIIDLSLSLARVPSKKTTSTFLRHAATHGIVEYDREAPHKS